MKPGEIVRIGQNVSPAYLRGILAVVEREVQGEYRLRVRIVDDKRAKKYADGSWCLSTTTLRPLDEEHPLARLTAALDPIVERGAESWTQAIAQELAGNVEAARQAAAEHDLAELSVPFIHWRFYSLLELGLAGLARGWEYETLKALRNAV